MITRDEALDAACRLFDEDHQLVEAIDAKAHGHTCFFNDYGDRHYVVCILEKFRHEALVTGLKCSWVRCHDVAHECYKIAGYISSVMDYCDKNTGDRLPLLIKSGQSAVDAASVKVIK